jgi:hypothetical protein
MEIILFKIPAEVAETSPFDNLAASDLADMHGQLGAEIAILEARRKAIAAELIARGVHHAQGGLFEAAVVRETMVSPGISNGRSGAPRCARCRDLRRTPTGKR